MQRIELSHGKIHNSKYIKNHCNYQKYCLMFKTSWKLKIRIFNLRHELSLFYNLMEIKITLKYDIDKCDWRETNMELQQILLIEIF